MNRSHQLAVLSTGWAAFLIRRHYAKRRFRNQYEIYDQYEPAHSHALAGPEWTAATNALVGRSVHWMGCVFDSAPLCQEEIQKSIRDLWPIWTSTQSCTCRARVSCSHQCTSWPFCPLDGLLFLFGIRQAPQSIFLCCWSLYFFCFWLFSLGPNLTHNYSAHLPSLLITYPTNLTIILITYPIHLTILWT